MSSFTMQTRNSIIEHLNIYRSNIVHILANISGRTETKAEMWLLIIL
ncbi:MAG: hypothetical protein WCL02_05450 [bacterium]